MPKVNCEAIGCTNSTYQLKKMDFGICDKNHAGSHNIMKGKFKDCEKSFALYSFSSVLKNGEQKKLWIKALKRENRDKTD